MYTLKTVDVKNHPNDFKHHEGWGQEEGKNELYVIHLNNS